MVETIGNTIDQIPVTISYRIIELFSAGLYSSPNKAFEELVSNSYDAMAKKVSVFVPQEKNADSVMWVCDNGNSMNPEELKQFWAIGESHKKDITESERMPIGKFGIGKLATYILARNLTIICKANDGKYYGTVMDYDRITDTTEKIQLEEKELSESDTKQLLEHLIKSPSGEQYLSFDLWGDNGEDTWTMVIMSKLKPKAFDIKDGRLKWVLSTALPLNPNFNLTFNGKLLESSKAAMIPWNTWTIGAEDDNIALKFADEYTIGKDENGTCYLDLPHLCKVTGKIDLYRDSLLTGKSEEYGRSHGIFLLVRKRLINIDDPLLGMDALTHGVFNRMRMVIEADGLNDYITSTRESIKSSEPLEELQQYIKRKFTEIRDWYFKNIEEEERCCSASYKISYAAASLSRQPIVSVAKKFYAGELSNLYLTEIPNFSTTDEQQKFIQSLEDQLTTESGIITNVEWESLNPNLPIARLDLASGTAKINLMHPFFANFMDEVKSLLPFQLIALTEILTECIMLEHGISQDSVRENMKKRDEILRELTYSDKPNAPYVAQLLMSSLDDAKGLEVNVTKAFNSLGFESTPIGGPGKPDGLANAIIGPLNSPLNYSVTFDAKSTQKGKIKAATAHVSGVKRHREDYHANYSCVVAIDFEGAEDPQSAVNKEARVDSITLIRAKDLAKLVLLSTPKQVGLNEIREFFNSCHTVPETSEWIDNIAHKEVERGPIKELLDTVYILNREDTEPAHLAAIRMRNDELKKYGMEDLETLIKSLERLTPKYIHIDNNKIVSLNVPPQKILDALNKITTDVPSEFAQLYIDAFQVNN